MEIFRQWGIEQRIRDRGLQDNSDMFVQVEKGRAMAYFAMLADVKREQQGATRP